MCQHSSRASVDRRRVSSGMSHQSFTFGGRQIALRVRPGIVASYCRSRVLISWQAADRALRFGWRSTGERIFGKMKNSVAMAVVAGALIVAATMAAVFRYEVTPVHPTGEPRFHRLTGKRQTRPHQKAAKEWYIA